MNYYFLLPLFDFYLNSLLFFRMYSRRNEHPAIGAYLLGILCSMVWGFSAFLLWLPIHPAATPYLLRLVPYGWFGIGFFVMSFMYAYQGRPHDFQYKALGFFTILVYLVFTILSWSTQASSYLPRDIYGYYGWWVNVFSLLSFLLPSTWTMWLVLQAIQKETHHPRRTVFIRLFFSGTLAIILISTARPLAHFFGLSPAPMNFIPAILLSLIILWVIQRYGFLGFNLSFVAKDLFDEMQDGVLLLNKEKQVVNINPAARLLLSIKKIQLPILLTEILPESTQETSFEKLKINRDGNLSILDFSITPLNDSWNGSGQLIILHDLTAEMRAENRALELEVQKKIDAAMYSERQRVARDLHDGVSQILYSMKLTTELLPVLWEQNPGAVKRKIADLNTLAQSAMVEMRTLLLELRPDRILETPLAELLYLLSQVGSIYPNIAIIIEVEEQIKSLPARVHEVFYRIAQEALNNAMRHSHPKTVRLSLMEANRQVTLRVDDDGDGFVVVDDIKGNHFGLQNMRERAEEANMLFEIKTNPGLGTTVKVSWARPLGELE